MYTIKQAAARTGLTVPVLRAWQRRYGVVNPDRTDAGYRLYSEEDIARLRVMRQLVDDGWTPSTAATSVARLGDDAIRERVDLGALARRGKEEPAGLVDRFVGAATVLDTTSLEAVLDEMASLGSFEHVAQTYLLPALVALGAAWEGGALDIAAEHAATHAVLRRLAAAFQAAGRASAIARPVLVGLPPGSRHELGALAFGVAARRVGLPVVYLGADLPVDDWIEAATQTGARAAVIGIVTQGDRRAALNVVEALRRAAPDVLLAVGGDGALDAQLPPDVLRLPMELSDAAEALRSATQVAPESGEVALGR